MIPADRIERARDVAIETVLAQLGIRLVRESAAEWVGPCPICRAGKDRFRLNVRKQLWRCRVCGFGGGDAISLVMRAEALSFPETVERLAGASIRSAPPAEKRANVAKRTPTHTNNNLGIALSIWDETGDPVGTPVDRYLAKRRVILPAGCNCVRFHPRCPFGKDADGATIYTPAMVALVVDIIDNAPIGIHRTAIDLQGNPVKIKFGDRDCKKATLGPVRGGAVKFAPEADRLVIAEGIETGLSLPVLRDEWAGVPVWSVLSRTGIRDFPLLDGVETLAVCVDNDEPGVLDARQGVTRWLAAGRKVQVFRHSEWGLDLNDAATGRVT
jgi:putative DNA primase/helicase